ncbi:MAG: PaaI family thioesterase [Bacteroidia bacterium]|nr:MAG: PaaI family thioesterase [Bacteroidia bacterium]
MPGWLRKRDALNEKRVKIKNPFAWEQNGCFGCGPSNAAGLRLTFEESDTHLHAAWNPIPEYQGYINVIHGGIIATLLDETGAWCINVKVGTAAVTSVMTVRYLKPAYISKGVVTIDAELKSRDQKSAKLYCRLFDGDGKLCSEADIEYFLYPEEIARKRYFYPGREAFYYE